MKKYNAILVLGRGIYKDGSIPNSAKATIRKAVELYNQKSSSNIIFSGKWSYKIDYTPPITEAEAMANYAKSLGLSEEAICIEKESVNTVFNLYNIKKQFLEPNDWYKVALVSLDPVYKRAFNDLKKMLGSKYQCDLIIAQFKFPKQKYEQIKQNEEEKLKVADQFYAKIADGDDKAIYDKNIEYIKKRYPNFKL